MKKFQSLQLGMLLCLASCHMPQSPVTDNHFSADTSVSFPFKEMYSSQWNNKVPDSDLLDVINSYKDWQDDNIKAMAGTFSDSISCYFSNGSEFNGTGDSLTRYFSKVRDSLSTVKLEFDEWIKNHSIDRNRNWVTLWYKETDTYKNGAVDSNYYVDDNEVKNGKIIFFDSQKRVLKK